MDEQQIPLSQVPDIVLNAAIAAVPGVTFEEAEVETEDGLTIYELEGEANGQEAEVEVTADGQILEVSQELAIADVPQNVLNAATAAIPGIIFEEAELETEDGVTTFELEGEANGQEYEVLVSSSGEVLEIELEDEDEDSDGDEDEDEDDEQEIALSEVPQNVLDAATAAVPGITLEEAEVETEDGVTIYELEGEANGRETEVEVSIDGQVLEISQELALSDVPEAVLNAATTAVPGITLEEAELETESGVSTFELEGAANGQEYEISVSSSGEVLEVELDNEGDDLITGTDDDDAIFGGNGNDVINAGMGRDAANGNQGNDFVLGDAGDDAVNGGQGDDWVVGGTGNDVVSGDLGNDAANGNQGNDFVVGGDGNDAVNGGQGSDTVVGGNGNDLIDGDRGSDMLLGGSGADSFVVEQVDAMDVVMDFNLAEGDRVLAVMEIIDEFTLETIDTNGDGSLDAVDMMLGGNSVMRFEGTTDMAGIASVVVPVSSDVLL